MPEVNQVELHPFLVQSDLREVCRRQGEATHTFILIYIYMIVTTLTFTNAQTHIYERMFDSSVFEFGPGRQQLVGPSRCD